MVADKKAKQKGQLSSEDVEDMAEEIGRLEGRFMRAKKQTEDLYSLVYSSKEKLSQHDIEGKLERRRQELEELEKILSDITFDNKNIRDKIS